jgi:hypothetical protein
VAFDIEGETVRCFTNGSDRLWRRECEYFQRMLAKYCEGFCPHVALAVWRAGEEGIMDIRGVDV